MGEINNNSEMKKKLQQFTRAISKIRDTLRSVGITDKDSLNHCILFATFRMTTVKLCKKFNIPEKYAFENFEKPDNDDNDILDDEELRNKFYNPASEDCYVYNYRTKLGITNFKFNNSIKNHKFREIYFKLKDIPLTELNNCIDIIGYIYEDHLRTGAKGKTGRDLGQYFTHREVIRFMLKLADPKVKKDKYIETIVDPTMGTGGFLCTAVEYLNKKYKNIDWKVNSKRLFGFDIAKDVAELGHLNLILALEEKCENVCSESQDTLCEDMLIENAPITADIILANEPMGLQGFKHAQFCQRIKDAKIYGTRVEPAFIQLFMEALNDNGRCVVIVPDGFLFQNGKQFVETRRKLLEEFEVKEVIKMNDKNFFTNTKIKASIIFFEKSGKQSDTVKFSEISLDKNEEIIQKNLLEVKTGEILENETCNLNYSLYLENQKTEDKDSFIFLKDVCTFKNGKQLSKKNFVDGNIPVIGGGKQPVGYHNKSNTVKNTILVASSGSAGYISKYDTDVWASDCFAVIPDETKILNNFLFYYLKSRQDDIYKKQTGTAQQHVYSKDIENIKIPIITLEKQKELVERLDFFYENSALLEKTITGLKYKLETRAWIESMKCKNFTILSDLCTFKNGKQLSKKNFVDGNIPVIGGGKQPVGYHNKSNTLKNTILVSSSGANAGYISKYDTNVWASDCFAVIPDETKILNNFLFYYLKSIQSDIYKKQTGTAQPHIYSKDIANIKIPVLTLEKQDEIIKLNKTTEDLILQLEKEITENNHFIKITLDTALNCEEFFTENNIEETDSNKSEELSEDET